MNQTIRISVFHRKMPYEMTHVDEEVTIRWEDLPDLITRTAYSPSLFRQPETESESQRLNKNFLGADALVLDVDYGGYKPGCPSLEQAPEAFKGYKAIIAPTKNHQRPKKVEGGTRVTCDRYRVILPLDRRIETPEAFRATWKAASEKWPFIDDCSDEARYYDPSRSVAYVLDGAPFRVVDAEPLTIGGQRGRVQDSARSVVANRALLPRLPLSQATWDFIFHPPEPQWRKALVKATYDAKQQGWIKDEWKQLATLAATNPERELDADDHRTIDDIYSNRETHPPRFPSYRPGRDPGQPLSNLIPSDEDMLAEITIDEKLRQMALDHPIELSFLYHRKYGAFNLPMGSTLFGARSGRGKSATAANVVADVVRKYPNKTILALTTEETTEGFFNRVACALEGLSFSKLQSGTLPACDAQKLKSCIREKLVKPIRVKHGITTLEDAIAVFEAAVGHNPPFDLIILDYVQNISTSSNQAELNERWKVVKAFGDYLANFGTRVVTRVVVFAQLKANSDSQDFQDRIQYDKTFLQHMKVGIEIKPNFDTQMTEFIIHKHRDGIWHVGAVAAAQFDDSTFRYDPIRNADDIRTRTRGSQQRETKIRSLKQVGIQASDSFMPTESTATHDDAAPF